MSSIAERYGIVFDAAVEIDRVQLKNNQQVYAETARQLENSPAVRQVEQSAASLGDRAGRRMNEALAARVRGAAGILRGELNRALGEGGVIDIDPRFDRAKFQAGVAQLTTGMDDVVNGNLTKGLHAAVARQVRAGFRAGMAQAGRIAPVKVDVQLTGSIQDELLRLQQGALSKIGVDAEIRNLPRLQQQMQGLKIDAALTPQARRALQTIEALNLGKSQTLRLNVQRNADVDRLLRGMQTVVNVTVSTDGLDFTALYRESAKAGRQAAIAASTAFRRQFNSALNSMRFRVRVDAQIGRVLAPRGGSPVIDVAGRTARSLPAPAPRALPAPAQPAPQSRTSQIRGTPPAPPRRNPLPPFDPNARPSQSGGASRAPNTPVAPVSQARPPAPAPYVPLRDRLPQAHYRLRDDWAIAARNNRAEAPRRLEPWERPRPGFLPVRSARGIQEVPAGPYLDTISDLGMDRQGRVVTTLSDDQIKRGKRLTKPGEHRRPVALRDRPGNRVNTFFTTGRHLGPDGTTYANKNVRPVIERAVDVRPKSGQELGEMIRVGETIAPGTTRQLAQGSYATYQATKRDVPMVVRHIEDILDDKGQPTGSRRVHLQSDPSVGFDRAVVDYKNLGSKGAVLASDFGRNLTVRGANNKFMPKPDFIAEGKDAGAMALRFWQSQNADERRQLLRSVKGVPGLDSSRIEQIAGASPRSLKYHAEPLYQAFEQIAPRYRATADLWQDVTQQSAADYFVQDYYGDSKRDRTYDPRARRAALERARREGRLGRSDVDGLVRARMTSEGLMLPQVATLSEDFEPRKTWMSRENVEQIRRHNPELAKRIVKESQGTRRAYGAMINVHQANQRLAKGFDVDLGKSGTVMASRDIHFGELTARTNELLASDMGKSVEEIANMDRSAIGRDRYNNARSQAFRSLYGTPDYLELDINGSKRYLPGPAAMSQFGESGQVFGLAGENPTYDKRATRLMGGFGDVMDNLQSGNRRGLESAFGGYWKAQDEVMTGNEFIKRGQGYFLPQNKMSGHTLRISGALQDNEVFVPGWEGGSAAVGRAPYMFSEANAGGLRVLTEQEWVARGGNPNESGISSRMATVLGGDTDGDNVTFLRDSGAIGDPAQVRAAVEREAMRRTRYGSNDQVKAPFGIKSYDELATSLKAPRKFDAKQVAADMQRFNSMVGKIGPAYNTTNNRLRASAGQGGLVGPELDFVDAVHSSTYSRTQVPKDLPAGLTQVMDDLSSGSYDLAGRRRSMIKGLLDSGSFTTSDVVNLSAGFTRDASERARLQGGMANYLRTGDAAALNEIVDGLDTRHFAQQSVAGRAMLGQATTRELRDIAEIEGSGFSRDEAVRKIRNRRDTRHLFEGMNDSEIFALLDKREASTATTARRSENAGIRLRQSNQGLASAMLMGTLPDNVDFSLIENPAEITRNAQEQLLRNNRLMNAANTLSPDNLALADIEQLRQHDLNSAQRRAAERNLADSVRRGNLPDEALGHLLPLLPEDLQRDLGQRGIVASEARLLDKDKLRLRAIESMAASGKSMGQIRDEARSIRHTDIDDRARLTAAKANNAQEGWGVITQNTEDLADVMDDAFEDVNEATARAKQTSDQALIDAEAVAAGHVPPTGGGGRGGSGGGAGGGGVGPGDGENADEWWERIRRKNRRQATEGIEDIFDRTELRKNAYGSLSKRDAFKRFAADRPDLANMLYEEGIKADRSGTIRDEAFRSGYARDLDRIVDADARAIGMEGEHSAAVEQFRARRQMYADRSRGMAEFRSFLDDPNFTFSQDPMRDQQERAIAQRMRGLSSPEELQAIRRGDYRQYQRTAGRARRLTHLRGMGSAMFANAGGFALASVGMAAFTRVAQQIGEYEQSLNAAEAMINLNRGMQGVDAEAFTNRAGAAGRGIRASRSEMVALARAYSEQGGDAERAVELTEQMAGMVRATGESVKELSGFLSASEAAGFRDPQEIAEYAVARGVSLGDINKAVQALGPGLRDLSDDQRAAAIVGFNESEGIKLSQNDAIRERQMERIIQVGEASTAFADTEKGMGSFQKATAALGDQILRLWESLKPGLSILAEIATLFLKAANGVLSLVNAIPGGGALTALGMLAASVAAISGAWNAMAKNQVFQTALDGATAAGRWMLGNIRGVGQGLGRAGNRAWMAVGGAPGSFGPQASAWARSQMGRAQRLAGANAQMGIVPPWVTVGMGGSTGRGVGHYARRFARRGSVAAGRVAQAAGRSGVGAAARMGAGMVGQGALALGGRALAMGGMLLNPWTLAAGTLALGGYGVYRGIRNQRRASRFRSLRGEASQEELVRAYSGELSKDLENAGYTVEEIRSTIDDAAKSGAIGIERMAKAVQDLAQQYQAVKKAVDDYGKTYERYFSEERDRITTTGVAYLSENNPLMGLLEEGQVLGGAYDEVRSQGNDLVAARFATTGDQIASRWEQFLQGITFFDEVGRFFGADISTHRDRMRGSSLWQEAENERREFERLRSGYDQLDRQNDGSLPNATGIAGLVNNILAAAGLRGQEANRTNLVRVQSGAIADVIATFAAEERAREDLRQEIIDAEVESARGGFGNRGRRREQLEELSMDELLYGPDTDLAPENQQRLREQEAAIRQQRIQRLEAMRQWRVQQAGLDERLGVNYAGERGLVISQFLTGERDLASIGQEDSGTTRAQLEAARANYQSVPLELGIDPELFAQLEFEVDGQIKNIKENRDLLGANGTTLQEANRALDEWGDTVVGAADQMRALALKLQQQQLDEIFRDAIRDQIGRGQFDPFAIMTGAQTALGSNRQLEQMINDQLATNPEALNPDSPMLTRNEEGKLVLSEYGRQQTARVGMSLDQGSDAATRVLRALESGAPVSDELLADLGSQFDPNAYREVSGLFNLPGMSPEAFRSFIQTTGVESALEQADQVSLQDMQAANQALLAEDLRQLDVSNRGLANPTPEDVRRLEGEAQIAQDRRRAQLDVAEQLTQIGRRYAVESNGVDMITTEQYRGFDYQRPTQFVEGGAEAYQREVAQVLASVAQQEEELADRANQLASQTTVSGLERQLEESTAGMNNADRVNAELAAYGEFLQRMGGSLDDAVEASLIERKNALERQKADIQRQVSIDLREFRESTTSLTDELLGVTTGGGQGEQILQLARQYASNDNLNAAQRARIGVTNDPNNPFAEGGPLERMFIAQDGYQQTFNQMLDRMAPTMQAIEQSQSTTGQLLGAGSLEEALQAMEAEGGTLEGFAQQRLGSLAEDRAQSLRATAMADGRYLSEEDALRLAREDVSGSAIGQFLGGLPGLRDQLMDQRRSLRAGGDDIGRYLTGDVTVRDAQERLRAYRQQIADSGLAEDNPLRQRAEAIADDLAANAAAIDDAEEIFQQAQVDTEGMDREEAFGIQNDALDEAVALLRERGVAEETINTIFGARLRQYEQEEEQLERINEQFRRRIGHELGLQNLRLREVNLGGTLTTENDIGVQREAIRLERDLETIRQQRDNRIAQADELEDENDRAVEIGAARREADMAMRERREAYRQTLTQQAVQLSSSGLGRFETLSDRASALERIAGTGVLADEDLQLLKPQIDAIRQGAGSGFGGILSTVQGTLSTGGSLNDRQIQALTAGFAGADPALQQMTAEIVNQAIQESPALEALQDERAGDAYETLSEQLKRTAGQIAALEGLGADQDLLSGEQLRQLRQTEAELEARLRIRDEITSPAEQARRRLDDFEGSRTEQVAAIGAYRDEIASLIEGEAGLTPEQLLGLDAQALEQLDNRTDGAADTLVQLAEAFEQAGDRADELTVQINQLAEAMGVSEGQVALEDAQRAGADGTSLDQRYLALIAEQEGVVSGRLQDGFSIEDAIYAARTNDVEALNEMVRVGEKESQQQARSFLSQNALGLFNTRNERVGSVLGQVQEDLVSKARERFSQGPLSAEEAAGVLANLDQQMLGRIADFEGQGADLEPFREWVTSGQAGQSFAEAFIKSDLEASNESAQSLANQGRFGDAQLRAAASMERTVALIQALLDARGIDFTVGENRPEVDATLLGNMGLDGLGNLLLMNQASGQAVRASRGRNRVSRLQNRFELNRPLFETPVNMLDYERDQLSATNAMLEQQGFVNLDANGEVIAETSNDAMVEVWEQNMARIKEITEDRFLAIQKIFHDVTSGMIKDLRNTVVEGISTVLTEGLFGGIARRRQEVEQEFTSEADFAESELERARNAKERIEEELAEVDDPDRRRELEAEYDYQVERVKELEATLREINHQWELQKEKIKTISELLADMLAQLGEQFLDRIIGAFVDFGFGAVFGSGSGGGSGSFNPMGLFGGGATGAGVSGMPAAQGADAPLLYDDPRSVQQNAQTAAGQNAGLQQAWMGGMSAFGVASQEGGGGFIGGMAAGGGSLLLQSALTGAAINPVAFAGVALGAAIGDIVQTTKWWNERLRAEAQGTVDSMSMFGVPEGRRAVVTRSTPLDEDDDLYSGTRSGVNIRVEMQGARLDDYATSRQLGRKIQTETRKTANRRGLKGG